MKSSHSGQEVELTADSVEPLGQCDTNVIDRQSDMYKNSYCYFKALF